MARDEKRECFIELARKAKTFESVDSLITYFIAECDKLVRRIKNISDNLNDRVDEWGERFSLILPARSNHKTIYKEKATIVAHYRTQVDG